ncbi:MAG: MarR family transcriptional regulator [Bacillota bacterium]|nr:MarR family transcriptional regulator [Bacillota bacterium]MDW7683275.1 MarR family transcriptional regulator [Bacillota bacterium]
MMVDFKETEVFTTAFQEIFPKLMHYLETEEIRELTGLGITPGQINALLILYMHDDLTMGALSTEIYLAESAATRLVDRLVKINLVKRKGDDKDRRVVRVYLTSYGRQLASLVFERRSKRFRNLSERLSPEEREMLIKSVKAVLRVFEELETEADKNSNGQKTEKK